MRLAVFGLFCAQNGAYVSILFRPSYVAHDTWRKQIDPWFSKFYLRILYSFYELVIRVVVYIETVFA